MLRKWLLSFISLTTLLALFSTSTAYANPRISISTTSFNFAEGSVANLQITLNEPIICSVEDSTCNVTLNLSSSDPSRVSISPSTIVIPYANWSQTQTVTISAVDSDTFSNGETVTISTQPIVSNSTYYNNFQPANVYVSIPPAPAPVLSNQTVNVTSNGSGTTVDVLSGATDNPDPSTLTITSGPSHGVAVDPVGNITYTADQGYTGPDSLTYQVCSSVEASICSTGTLGFNDTAEAVADPVTSPDTGFGTPLDTFTKTNLPLYLGAFSLFTLLAGYILLAKKSS